MVTKRPRPYPRNRRGFQGRGDCHRRGEDGRFILSNDSSGRSRIIVFYQLKYGLAWSMADEATCNHKQHPAAAPSGSECIRIINNETKEEAVEEG